MFAQQPSVQAYGQGQPQQQQPPPPAQMQQQSQQQQHFHQQLLKSQQQALMQQALMQQQAALYNPALLAAMSSQIEPIPSGNLPPGFDATSCRSVYVGNINSKVTEALLAEVFGSIGPLEGCKLIRKEKSSFGFVDYYDHQFAARAIVSLNGRQIFGQSIKVNWAYASGQREDTTGHFHVFVGDLSPEVTDATLFAAFSLYRSCSDARVMWDQRSGRSRGFGFVSFKNQKDAESAITEMTGKWLGSRAIRCNWATKTNADNQNGDPRPRTTDQVSTGNGPPRRIEAVSSPVTVASDFQQVLEASQKDAPEGNPQYTTVYVGNLAHEVTQTELHRQFYALKVGQIEDVRVQREKGFGFVRYSTHEEAAAAIQSANGKVICGKSVKCSWGNKPTPAGVASTILPPPVPVLPFQSLVGASLNQGYTTADLLAYQRQLALSQAGAGALLPLANQQNLGLGLAAGVNATANRSAMDGGGLGQQRFF